MSSLKDSLILMAIKPVINLYISDFGTLKNLYLDSKRKQIIISLELLGEETPLEIHIIRYEITKTTDKSFLVVREIDFSREWMNIALKKWHPEMKFPISNIVKPFL